ncbi:hypothetical protein KNE206_20880 [Kitasatospora sp. NE20-6]|uniref:hypothetical protein n=1 Tax=Kitasatospora sp. NE20-6 TaxID=2859066 RepID=UPI0034DBDF62
MHAREWLPDQPVRIGRIDWPERNNDGTHIHLEAGRTVVLDRQPWQILEIHEHPDREWPEAYRKAWNEHVELWRHSENLYSSGGASGLLQPDRADFYKRPMILVLRNENFPRSAPKHWCAPASHDWQVLPEHYAVCRTCGELPPCHNGEYRWNGGPRKAEHNGGIGLIVPPGCCMGCAELIRPRVRTVRFPGPNLWYPDLGYGSAVFHARTACADQVDCYRMQWRSEYTARNPQSSPDLFFPDGENFTLPRTRLASDHAQPTQDLSVPNGFSPATHAMFPAPHGNLPPVTTSVPPEFQQSSAHQQPAAQVAHQVQAAHQQPSAHQQSVGHQAQAAHQQPSTHQQSVTHQQSATHQVQAAHQQPAAHQAQAAQPAQIVHQQPSVAPVQSFVPSAPAEDIDAVLRLTGALDLAMADRPAFHDAEQAARVIEELTAAVRNIALCLNGTNTRARA